MPGRRHGTVLDYDFQRGHGILEADDGTRYFLHQQNMLGQGMKDADPGDEVTFLPGESTRGAEGDPVALEVKLGDPRKPLYRFAQVPLEPAEWLDVLAEKAATEVWDYQYERKGEGGHLPILRHYLEQTFERLQEEDEQGHGTIVETTRRDGQRVAIFNTGLVTSEEEPIYACFAENHQPERAPWFLRGFYSGSERELSDVQVELPPPADYLSQSDRLIIRPEEIRAMRVDFRHIAVEHLDRFPEILRTDPNLADAALRGDIGRLPDRIRRNYKAAVPQRYRGEIQMLLPLDLVAPRGRPDLALVVERKDAGCRANTVLGVDAAYRQARLIARPDPEWLGQAWLSPE
jgi:cold shock CspA family protein